MERESCQGCERFSASTPKGFALITFPLHATNGAAYWHIKTAKEYEKNS
jgi:hypothetical protein